MAFVGSSAVPLFGARPPAICVGLGRARPLPARAAVRADPLVMKDKAKRKPRKPAGPKRTHRAPPPAAADAAAIPGAETVGPVAPPSETATPVTAEAPTAPPVEASVAPMIQAPVTGDAATATTVATPAKVSVATTPIETPAEDLFPEPARADAADDAREPAKPERGRLLPPWAAEVGGVVLIFVLSLVLGGVLSSLMAGDIPVPAGSPNHGP